VRPTPTCFGYEFGFEPLPWYFLILAVGFLVIVTKARLAKLALGTGPGMAIREDEIAADCMGVDPIKTKLFSFLPWAPSFAGAGRCRLRRQVTGYFSQKLFRFQSVHYTALHCYYWAGWATSRASVPGGDVSFCFLTASFWRKSTQLVRGSSGKLVGSELLARALICPCGAGFFFWPSP